LIELHHPIYSSLFEVMNRFLYVLTFTLAVSLSYSQTLETNEVILPETNFTVQGVSPYEVTDRNVIFETSEGKSTIKEIPSLKGGVFELEKEVKTKGEAKSKIISSFSYGIGDIIDLSLVGMSEIPSESYSVSTLIKYSRFKRPDILHYPTEGNEILKNTFRDIDLGSFTINHFTKSTFLTIDGQFFEDFKGLWKNPYFSDERDRNVNINGIFKYTIDKDSKLTSALKVDHTYVSLRSNTLDKVSYSFNDFFANLGYQYGSDEYNFFKFELGLGANLISKTNSLIGMYGDISASLAFPLYMNSFFFVSSLSLIPDYFFPFDFSLNLGGVYKFSQDVSLYLDLRKGISRLSGEELIKGITFVDSNVRDSFLGTETGVKVFIGKGDSVKLAVGYDYYLSKYYSRPIFDSFSYVMDITNVSLFYSRVYVDIISLDWFNLGVTYNFNLNFPIIIPYVPLHSLDGVLKFSFGGFYLSLSLSGEYLISSDGVNFDIPPYAIVSLDSEYEIVKNISLSLNCRNLLNNIAEFRKDSVISEGIYASLGIKVKL